MSFFFYSGKKKEASSTLDTTFLDKYLNKSRKSVEIKKCNKNVVKSSKEEKKKDGLKYDAIKGVL